MNKQDLIAAIIDSGNLKWNERAHLVYNGLGAHAIFFASDFSFDGEETVTKKPCVGLKALQSVDYAVSLADENVFNALRHIPQCIAEKDVNDISYLTIGLYLMLADAVSRNPKGKTFLEACHEHKLELDIYTASPTNAQKDELAQKFQAVLETLGIAEEFPGLVKTWKDEAQFVSFGITNGQVTGDVLSKNEDGTFQYSPDPLKIPEASKPYTRGNFYAGLSGFLPRVDTVFGPYAKLAMDVCNLQDKLGVNTAISYALGNSWNQQMLRKRFGDSIPEDRKLLNVTLALENREVLIQRMEGGHILRAERMENRASAHFGIRDIKYFANKEKSGEEWEEINKLHEAIKAANKLQDEKRGVCEAILGYFPTDLAQIADKVKYTYVGTDDTDTRSVYPEGDIPGLKHKDVELTRNSSGGNLSRYGFIAFALGDRMKGWKKRGIEATPDLKNRAAAQTAIHETMHRVFNDHMTQYERDKLYDLVKELPVYPEEVWSMVIPTNSFNVIINPNSPYLYDNYKGNEKLEEVICNLYSLWYTEPNPMQSPLNESQVQELIKKMEEYVGNARDRLLAPKETTQPAAGGLPTTHRIAANSAVTAIA